jgi:translation initiation factor RLI1
MLDRGALDKITREQMIAEFGENGVQNPVVIDLITLDKASDTVVLVMTERRPWGAVAQQLSQIEEKVNRYMGYVLDGFLAEHYPQYMGKAVRIRLDCAEAPHGESARFVEAMTDAIEGHGIHFAMTVLPPLA